MSGKTREPQRPVTAKTVKYHERNTICFQCFIIFEPSFIFITFQIMTVSHFSTNALVFAGKPKPSPRHAVACIFLNVKIIYVVGTPFEIQIFHRKIETAKENFHINVEFMTYRPWANEYLHRKHNNGLVSIK